MQKITLPDPSPISLQRSNTLKEKIRVEIETSGEGSIGFDRFMDMALYDDDLGYYTGPGEVFGQKGDYVTAPELGSIFGRCLARLCYPIINTTRGDILEFGAGNGTLARTILENIAAIPSLDQCNYYILERSKELKATQKELLVNTLGLDNVSWLKRLPSSPLRGIILANEVLDAFAVKRFEVHNGSVLEMKVGVRGEDFIWLLTDTEDFSWEGKFELLSALPEGYRFEVNLSARRWLRQVLDVLNNGIVLVIDYGYARHELLHPSRRSGTLRCYYQHYAHDDPFILPGLQDITASVNFTELAELATEFGTKVVGFTTLNRFLIDIGAEQIFQELLTGDPAVDYELSQEVKRLLLPSEMGQTIKVMALASDCDGQVLGFGNDLRHTLTELFCG